MKHQYVQTSNHVLFCDMVHSVESRAAAEARIVLLAGDPGTGKSRCVDNFGAERNAIYIEGMPSMTLSYTRELLAHELGVTGLKGFALQKAISEAIGDERRAIILDEAQHGLNKKAEVIEYLRRVCEQYGCLLVLVCHTTERHRFGEHKLAHISTRISGLVDFKPANIEDTTLYLNTLCEVGIGEGIAKVAMDQSRGRYRLLSNACNTLETIAKAKGKNSLSIDDIKGLQLCEDAMWSIRRGNK